MKKIILFSLLTLAFGTSKILGQNKLKTVKDVPFDKVFIYEFDPSPEEPNFRKITQSSIMLLDTIRGLKHTFINLEETSKLYDFLSSPKSFDIGASICWEPHLGIIFLKNNIEVNYISVCMECNKLKSMLYIPATKTIKSKGKDRINIEKGMTPEFRRFLNSLLTKYNFKYAMKHNDSIWDRQ